MSKLGKFYASSHKGIFKIKYPERYVGDPLSVLYRSSLELSVFMNLERASNIKRWGAEVVQIPYFFDGKMRHYIMDIYCEIEDSSNVIQKYLIEIKHSKKLKIPKRPKYITERFRLLLYEFAMNQEKWKAARTFAQKHECSFKVITETDLDLRSLGVKYGD